MKVLVACEFSGIVREAFKSKGHDAWSCDILPTEVAGNHIQDNVLNHLHQGWDLLIAHPPCTYISNMSNCRIKQEGRRELREKGFNFFMEFTKTNIPKVAIENPRGLPERRFRKADQIIQPYHFGHSYSKATCLWLTGLLPLKPTNIVDYERRWDGKRYRTWVDFHGSHNAKSRSITFAGIAKAMADQWG